ncbi:MAG: 23S rRNA (uracil(1939)-C(5))-methyltransferase RlmD [Cyanobacteria bacterium RM1_2_2]|nr:23S rRNA (uracil(1939)-C(5))-methyltransferase RlmD [Cyanobacteria bacterium RM1_2_2]
MEIEQTREAGEAEKTREESQSQWQQGALLEVSITDLNHNGEGVGRWQERVVFVPDAVPGDRVRVRLVRVKPGYAQGKLHELIAASPHRVRPSCIVADKCGGCQWQHVDYGYQLEVKRNLVIQDLERIGGFTQPPVDPVLAVAPALGYRNKSTYPVKAVSRSDMSRSDVGHSRPVLSRNPSRHQAALGLKLKPRIVSAPSTPMVQVQAGYYQKGSHQLVNLNQCPIQDGRLNPFLAQIKLDIQQRGWSIYDEQSHQGEIRHLSLRIGQRTGEVLLTLVARKGDLPDLAEQAQFWLQHYPELVGVCLNLNPDRTNAIFGDKTHCLAGRPYLHEISAGLSFQIHPTTFFQVNTEQAEALLQIIQAELNLQGTEHLVDAYCGVGTMTLPLAKQTRQVIGIEVQPEAIEQAKQNAQLNGIDNAEFQIGKVETLLPELSMQPDIVLLDPPRKGCEPSVIDTLLKINPQRIVYVSCNPATLARDLKLLSSAYTLKRVQPADFFPQTAHVECAAFLEAK